MLVTGAAGLLGSRVVCQLLDRGHAVRAVVRPTARALPEEWHNRAEVVQADLQTSPALDRLFDGVDALVHLAAAMHETAEAQRAITTICTERLLEAMRMARSTRHVVLAGSCSVYDWTASQAILNEESPLEAMLYDRDGYTVAKILQERITRRFAEDNRWILSVLRPGFIYGPGASPAGGVGFGLGRVFLVIAPTARLRLTHVENCAGAFVNAVEKRTAGTFNIIDDDHVSAWRYSARLHGSNSSYFRIPVPYSAGLGIAYMARLAGCALSPARREKLPGILNPRQFRARFKPLQYENRRAKEGLGWKCEHLFETGCDVI